MTKVNGVDTDTLRDAAEQLNDPGAADVVIHLPPRQAAGFLYDVAVRAEQTRPGQLIPGLQIAGRLVAEVLAR